MPLEKQHVPLVVKGMNTGVDAKHLDAGDLILAENMFMQKTKKWRNRYGYSRVGTSTYPDVIAMGSIGSEIYLFESDGVTTRIGTTTDQTWSGYSQMYCYQDFVKFPQATAMAVANSSLDLVVITGAPDNKIIWYSSGAIKYAASGFGLYLRSDKNGTVYGYLSGSNVSIIKSTGVTSSAHGVTWTANSSTGAIGYPKLCATYTGGISYCAMIYKDTATGDLYVKCYKEGTGWQTAVLVTNALTDGPICIGNDSAATTMTIGCPTGATTYGQYTYNVTSNTITASSSQSIPTEFVQDTTQLVESTACNGRVYYQGLTRTAGSVVKAGIPIIGFTFSSGSSNLITNYEIASIATYTGSSTAVVLSTNVVDSSKTTSHLFFDISSFTNAKEISFSHGYANSGARSEPYVLGNYVVVLSVTNEAGAIILDKTEPNQTVASWNGELYSSLGHPMLLSGSGLCYAGLQRFGGIISGTTAAAGGSLAGGSYQLFLAYKNTDSNGRLYYSPASDITTVSATASQKITVFFSSLPSSATQIIQFKQLYLFATSANGTVFYQIAQLNNNEIEGSYVFTDEPTSALTPWPFQGGVLEPGPIPLIRTISAALGRLWFVPVETSCEIGYSKLALPTEVAQFPSEFRLRLNNSLGEPVYVAEMDNKAVIFSEYGISVTWGNGPDETGAGEFAQPQVVSQSLGLRDPNSVVLTDNGLMFMSHEGIWLLNRGLTLQYIGKPVEDFNSYTVCKAVNLVDRAQIWFFTNNGTTLCFDDYHKLWSVFTYHDASGACLVGSIPHFVRDSDGYLLKESSSAFNDAGTTFDCILKSGWISFAGVQGFERLYRFTWTGAASDTASLTLYRDWSVSSFETFSISSSLSTQWQVRPKIQKCEAMQFNLTWPDITGLVELSALGIEAGLKRGTFKLAPASRVAGT